MNDDEKFQQELRTTLDGLAREPAPDRLVARVSEIPSREPSTLTSGIRRGASSRSFGSVLGLLAAGVAILALVVVVRPGELPPGVGASLTPPATSSAALGTASPNPQGSSVPTGFEPMSATFVSSADGWVLGSVPCESGRCPAIVRTTDGGSTWSSIAAPRTTIAPAGDLTGKGISSVRFENASDGWAFGPELWSTHDGGTTWARAPIGGLAATAPVVALETHKGAVHAVAYDGDHDFRIATSTIAVDDWRLAAVRVPVGAGPVPEVQLVLSGSAGWVLENDRTVTAGARLVDGTWQSWQPVCLDVVGPAVLAASSATDLVAVCDVGLMSNHSGEQLFSSKDGGRTFAQVGGKLPISSVVAVAMANSSTIAVGGSSSTGAAVLTSGDGGRTWPSMLNVGMVAIAQLGFTTETQGFVITSDASGAGVMRMTRDAGRTWTRISF
jgi:photosystem II stability/assembly factor-like uncharacterized protein